MLTSKRISIRANSLQFYSKTPPTHLISLYEVVHNKEAYLEGGFEEEKIDTTLTREKTFFVSRDNY